MSRHPVLASLRLGRQRDPGLVASRREMTRAPAGYGGVPLHVLQPQRAPQRAVRGHLKHWAQLLQRIRGSSGLSWGARLGRRYGGRTRRLRPVGTHTASTSGRTNRRWGDSPRSDRSAATRKRGRAPIIRAPRSVASFLSFQVSAYEPGPLALRTARIATSHNIPAAVALDEWGDPSIPQSGTRRPRGAPRSASSRRPTVRGGTPRNLSTLNHRV